MKIGIETEVAKIGATCPDGRLHAAVETALADMGWRFRRAEWFASPTYVVSLVHGKHKNLKRLRVSVEEDEQIRIAARPAGTAIFWQSKKGAALIDGFTRSLIAALPTERAGGD